MKKKLFTIALIMIFASVAVSGTLAYFTAEDTAHNVITSGAVAIDIEEWQQEGDALITYPDEPVEVMPGVTVSKIAQVRCLDAEAWIRAKYQIVVYDAQMRVMNLTDERLDEVFSVTLNETDWTPGEDGWYYYNTPVTNGEATAPLFTEVVFDGPNMTNEFQNCTVNVNVHAQGVQTANNPDRAGWPEE